MADSTEHDTWAGIFRDLVELIDNAPPPPRRYADNWTRQEQAGAHAVAVAWGWLTRIKRTSKAVFLLADESYAAESRPLVRSIMEHAIRLMWAAELELHIFVEVLLRSKSWSLEKTLEAAAKGWPLTPELQQAIEESRAEASEAHKSYDKYAHLANVVETNPKEFAGLYQYWLLETQYSHPTLWSANAYFSPSADGFGWTLHDDPRPFDDRDDVVLPSLLWISVSAFGRIAGLTDYFEEPLNDIGARMKSLGVPPGQSPAV